MAQVRREIDPYPLFLTIIAVVDAIAFIFGRGPWLGVGFLIVFLLFGFSVAIWARRKGYAIKRLRWWHVFLPGAIAFRIDWGIVVGISEILTASQLARSDIKRYKRDRA